MSKELSYVQPGEKILALQYNSLVDAIGGPVNPDNSTPFTLTKNGIVFNGGYTTSLPIVDEYNTPLFSTEFSTGSLNSGYYENGLDDWAGVWCFVGDWAECKLFKHEMTFGSFARFAVDFTSLHFRVISLNNLQSRVRLGKIPVCNIDSRAQVASFQVMQSAQTPLLAGLTFSVIGDFSKLPNYPEDPSSTDWMLAEFIEEEDYLDIIGAVQNWMSVDKIRLLDSRPIYAPFDDIEEQEDIPPVAYNVGLQTIETYPDSNNYSLVPSGTELSIHYLSSIAFTPAKYFGFQNPDTPTWSYSLYDFNKLDSTADDLSSIQLREDLSSYDVLVKHKALHPRANEDLLFSDLCSAVLEYMPISSLIGGSIHTGDANLSSHHLSSVYLSSDGQYQLYNFDKDGISYPYEGYVNDFEVVVRELYTSQHNGPQINYLPLSSFNLPGDTNIADYSRRKSIELLNNVGTKYYELYNFHDLGNAITSFGSPNGFDVVVRDYSVPGELPHISYVRLSALNTAISGDTNVFEGATHQSSIETILSGDLKWHQLYRWCENDGEINCTVPADGQDHYLANEGETYPGTKRFLMCDDTTRQLEYRDIVVNIPKIRMQDLDDTTITSIVNVISGDLSVDVSAIISASLSAGDDRYWIKGEDNTENYGSSIGNSNKTQVIDLDNKRLDCLTSLDYWTTGSLYADYNLKALDVEVSHEIKIGNTTLNESQLQQLLALLNAPQRLQQL